MKTKNAFLKIGFFVFLLTAMLLVNCTKDENALVTQGTLTTENVVIPDEIAMYLTDAEEADFYASKPTTPPTTDGVNAREGAWRPFFVSGNIEGNKYPLLANCDLPPAALIVPNEEDVLNVPENYVGYVGLWAGKATMEGFGPINQFYDDFVCGMNTSVENGLHNGSFKRGNGALYWGPYGTPYTVKFNEDGTVSVESKISICNAARATKNCFTYSTGVFEKMEGDGTITWRWTGNPVNFTSPLFEPFKTAHMMSWGWLFY
jgi:hypothetical protein